MNTMTPSVTPRRSNERGHADHGWLKSKHTFSFADYRDPHQQGFRTLRVINQDVVAPGGGFPTHPHRDMEIFSYVLQGQLKHQDSMGHSRVLRPGQIQLMSAGSGITHSEFNPSTSEPLHFLQIWIHPHTKGLTPRYTEWHPPTDGLSDAKTLLISPDGRDGSARIQQDAHIYRVQLAPGEETQHTLAEGRGLWIQIIRGPVQVAGVELAEGDGASSEDEGPYALRAGDTPVEALLFDLA